MDWRVKYAHKLTSAEKAVADVRSGQAVTVGMFDGMPPAVCTALANRATGPNVPMAGAGQVG